MQELEKEIHALQEEIKSKTQIVFTERLKLITGDLTNVSNILFNTIQDNLNNTAEWEISYDIAMCYNENNYNSPIDSDIECIDIDKKFTVCFGRNAKRHYIKGTNIRSNRFQIYTNSKNNLRVINADYDVELDLDEQSQLLEKYIENKNIPEWIALKVFTFMIDNAWNDTNIKYHFSIV